MIHNKNCNCYEETETRKNLVNASELDPLLKQAAQARLRKSQ